MTPILMNAILAMSAYDFGSEAAIDGDTYAKIGNWERYTRYTNDNINFLAVSYRQGDDWTISYRGTTSPFGNYILDGDIWNGWSIGAGSTASAAAIAAKTVYDTTLALAGDKSLITLTGHSLGGGLAGYVGAIYGLNGYLYDNMTFEAAALSTYRQSNALMSVSEYNQELKDSLYGPNEPIAPDMTKLQATAVKGEFLETIRGQQVTPVTEIDPFDANTMGAIDLHSQALMVMLLHAKENNLTGWNAIAPYLFDPVL